MIEMFDTIFNNTTKVTGLIEDILRDHIKCTESLYGLCKALHLSDSKVFMDWQDELNEISVRYEPDE